MTQEDRQVLQFLNPVVDSDTEDDNIFKSIRIIDLKYFQISLISVFNNFVNRWCVKKDKNVFKLAFRFHAFVKIPENLETHSFKKLNFQHY